MCEYNIDDVELTESHTRKIPFGCGNVYITVDTINMRPVRVFIRLGKQGGCQRALMEAVGRLITIMFRRGDPHEDIIKTLKGIRCDKGIVKKLSCMDVLAKELEAMIEPDTKS